MKLTGRPRPGLLWILAGMPLIAVVLAGRDPAGIGRQPLE